MELIRQQFLLLFSTPLYVIVIGVELIVSHFQRTVSYTIRDTFQNFCLSLLRGGTDLLMKGVTLAILSGCFYYRLFSPAHSFIYWMLLLLLVDMMHYWLHRLNHTCRIFWAVHVNHHSSEHFNISVGFRGAFLEPFYGFLFLMPIAFLGFQPADILFMYAIMEIWGVLTHTEKIKKLGWLEYVFVTPSHHRVHHASNEKYLDKNLSSIFIIWDRLFGTFQRELPPEEYEPIRYGITHPLKRQDLQGILFHEWKDIFKDVRRKDISWKQRWLCMFGRPGSEKSIS